MVNNKSRNTVWWPLLLITAVFFLWVSKFFGKDFWYDEVVSLEEFILVPLKKTVTDYPYPNNHIFFSILMNLWCKLWGITSFVRAADNTFIVRLLPAIISIATIITVFFTLKKLYGVNSGFMAALALACIIPFCNYAVQVRGYGLSMLLVALLVYVLLEYFRRPGIKYGALIVLFTALFLYTIPSNLYPVLAFGVVAAIGLISVWIKQGVRVAFTSPFFKAGLCTAGGVAIAVALYIPVLSPLLNNDYVKAGKMFRWEMWREALQIFQYLSMPFYWIPLIMLAGVILSVIKKQDIRLVGVLTAVIVLPFVFSFIRGDQPFDRTFLWICPLLAILFGVLWGNIEQVTRQYSWNNAFILASGVIIFIGFNFGINRVRERIQADLQAESISFDIYYNNLQNNYHTHKNLREFSQNGYSDTIPVFLHEVDKYAMHGYLPIHGIKWEPFPEKIKSVNKYYIITAYPNKAKEYYRQFDKKFWFETRYDITPDYVTIVEAERIK